MKDLRFPLVPFPSKTSQAAIVQSAADIIHSDGLTSLSMRTLAARLGVRASSLYRHFPDRLSIERTLAVRAADHLLDSLKVAVGESTGEAAVLTASRAYLNYASTEASFYDILMRSGIPLPGHSAATVGIWTFLVELVSSSTGFSQDVYGATALWSMLHGFAVLSRSGHLGDVNERKAVARGTQALLRGLAVLDSEAVSSSN